MRNVMKIQWLGLLLIGASFLLASCGSKVDPNELTTELLPVADNPLVHFRVLIKIGSANDPSGKEGLCQLAWSMLTGGGTRLMSIKEITEKFYPMAASVSLGVDKEMSVFSGTIH